MLRLMPRRILISVCDVAYCDVWEVGRVAKGTMEEIWASRLMSNIQRIAVTEMGSNKSVKNRERAQNEYIMRPVTQQGMNVYMQQ